MCSGPFGLPVSPATQQQMSITDLDEEEDEFDFSRGHAAYERGLAVLEEQVTNQTDAMQQRRKAI